MPSRIEKMQTATEKEIQLNLRRVKNRRTRWYKDVDPWGYQTNPEDIKRKEHIINLLEFLTKLGFHFETALDIGCGEGWVTQDIPADKIYGYDIVETIRERFPKNVIPLQEIKGKYDLIIATEILVKQNEYRWLLKKIRESAKGLVLTSTIRGWERNDLPNQIYEYEFPYREYTERLAIYDLRGTSHLSHERGKEK